MPHVAGQRGPQSTPPWHHSSTPSLRPISSSSSGCSTASSTGRQETQGRPPCSHTRPGLASRAMLTAAAKALPGPRPQAPDPHRARRPCTTFRRADTCTHPAPALQSRQTAQEQLTAILAPPAHPTEQLPTSHPPPGHRPEQDVSCKPRSRKWALPGSQCIWSLCSHFPSPQNCVLSTDFGYVCLSPQT